LLTSRRTLEKIVLKKQRYESSRNERGLRIMEKALILLVEDNPSNVKFIELLLEIAGYRVCAVGDAETAQKAIETTLPTLILMDIQLPGMDGLTLTSLLKRGATTRDIPIVALTAYAMKGDKEKALDAGCDSYVSKPIDRSSLLKVISQLLEAAKTRPTEPVPSSSSHTTNELPHA
jgi:two-component system, cell cycle response regulator DivK